MTPSILSCIWHRKNAGGCSHCLFAHEVWRIAKPAVSQYRHRRDTNAPSRVRHGLRVESRINRPGQTWYPSQIIRGSLERSPLITVETVERVYAEDAAYDMEATGFYPIAWHASTAELVQSLQGDLRPSG